MNVRYVFFPSFWVNGISNSIYHVAMVIQQSMYHSGRVGGKIEYEEDCIGSSRIQGLELVLKWVRDLPSKPRISIERD